MAYESGPGFVAAIQSSPEGAPALASDHLPPAAGSLEQNTFAAFLAAFASGSTPDSSASTGHSLDTFLFDLPALNDGGSGASANVRLESPEDDWPPGHLPFDPFGLALLGDFAFDTARPLGGSYPLVQAQLPDPTLGPGPQPPVSITDLYAATAQQATASFVSPWNEDSFGVVIPDFPSGQNADWWRSAFSYSSVYAAKPHTYMPTRMQNYEVQTPDGIDYAVVNRGVAGGLTMISSADGRNWSSDFSLPSTGIESSGDIHLLRGGELIVGYLNAADQVAFVKYSYDATDHSWKQQVSALVSPTVRDADVHPTIAINNQGDLFATYTDVTPHGLTLFVDESTDGGRSWNAVDHKIFVGATQGSARVLDMHGTIGIVYTVDHTLHFADYSPGAGLQQGQEIFSYQHDQVTYFTSHFSAIDVGGNRLVSTNDGDYHLVLLEYNQKIGWTEPQILTDDSERVTFSQLTLSSNGTVYLTYNDKLNDDIRVLESSNGGRTFTPYLTASLPAAEAGEAVHIAAPTETGANSFAVLAQVQNPFKHDIQELLSYNVPVEAPALPASVSAAADQFHFRHVAGETSRGEDHLQPASDQTVASAQIQEVLNSSQDDFSHGIAHHHHLLAATAHDAHL